MSEADERFWDLYNKDIEAANNLEAIMSDLNIEFKFDDEEDVNYLTDEEYEEVLKVFDNRGYKAAPTEEEFIERAIEALKKEFNHVVSFDDVGMMTHNYGIVVREGDKSFQLELCGSWH